MISSSSTYKLQRWRDNDAKKEIIRVREKNRPVYIYIVYVQCLGESRAGASACLNRCIHIYIHTVIAGSRTAAAVVNTYFMCTYV